MESLDGILAGHLDEDAIQKKHAYPEPIFENGMSKNHIIDSLPQSKPNNDSCLNHLKSDSESGFDESCSQMSRSGIDEGYTMTESSILTRTTSFEQLSLDQLLLELKSVAIDWRSFRNIDNCTCASPYDHFTKKARLSSFSFLIITPVFILS